MTARFAARYSSTPPSADECYSSAGWVLSFATEAQAQRFILELCGMCDRDDCRTCYDCNYSASERCPRCSDALERAADGTYRVSRASDGSYYVERYGLSCFYVDGSVRGAVEAAEADGRFPSDLPLWVFAIDGDIDIDEDTSVYPNCYRAVPSRRSRPRRVR